MYRPVKKVSHNGLAVLVCLLDVSKAFDLLNYGSFGVLNHDIIFVIDKYNRVYIPLPIHQFMLSNSIGLLHSKCRFGMFLIVFGWVVHGLSPVYLLCIWMVCMLLLVVMDVIGVSHLATGAFCYADDIVLLVPM